MVLVVGGWVGGWRAVVVVVVMVVQAFQKTCPNSFHSTHPKLADFKYLKIMRMDQECLGDATSSN